MSDEPSSRRDLANDRTDFAQDRTDLAEDRTVLANERMFSGWMRTALAAVGIGVGFNALFQQLEPAWVAKAVATVFVMLGMVIVVVAERRACAVVARLDAHKVTALRPLNLRLIAAIILLGAAALIVGIWFLLP